MTWLGQPPQGVDLFHLGIVVPDLRASMSQFTEIFGVEWTNVTNSARDMLIDGKRREIQLSTVYSTSGPLYLELIEEKSGGAYGPLDLMLNHIGCWSERIPVDSARINATGAPARVEDPNTDEALYAYHQLSAGFWLEFVSRPAFAPTLTRRIQDATSVSPQPERDSL